MIYIDNAIRTVHTNAVTISVKDIDTYSAKDIDGNEIELDEALITAEITRLQAEFDSKQYARDRAKAYPSLTDQADMAYWDRQNGTTTLDDTITAVKAAYPKI